MNVEIEPTREIIHRILRDGNTVTLRENEPTLVQRAIEMGLDGWLEIVDNWMAAGMNYVRFKATDRLEKKYLETMRRR